jgi:hypothetical protein
MEEPGALGLPVMELLPYVYLMGHFKNTNTSPHIKKIKFSFNFKNIEILC